MRKPTESHTWYTETAREPRRRPPLLGETRCDVCVVGAGYTGLLTALHLAERGYRTVVLEADRLGQGASGRNGGQVVSGYNLAMAEVERLVGRDDARRLWLLAEDGKAILQERMRRHGIDCGYRPGFVYAALRPRQMRELERLHAEMTRDYHLPNLALLDRTQVRGYVEGPAYLGGLYDPSAGHLHPLQWLYGLAEAADAAGVDRYEMSRALAVEDPPGRPLTVRTAHGRVQADWLILAGNAYLGALVPGIADTILPVSSFMLTTQPLGAAQARALIPFGGAVSDMNFVLNYYRTTADHRLLFGGGGSYTARHGEGYQRFLLRELRRTFPQLTDIQVHSFWGGNLAITWNRMPHFGQLGARTFFAHGFSGHGLAITTIAGRLMAEAVAGSAERFDVFARIPHARFPGGRLFKAPLVALAMTWYRLRDKLWL